MAIAPGTRLGPYEVVAPLGAGGMGEVWRARDTRLDRSVAIKVLPPEFEQNEQLKLRFEREARTISQLNHPNICTLYDVGEGYLVMELLEGESLADRLAKGPLPIEQVLRYGIEIADALARAHKAGVVHRDLKPGNIMITKSGAKLLDFGLAKPNESGVLSTLTSLRTEQKNALTEEGAIIGTFQYMAPEQVEGGEVDARTDIFALGAVLYEMATARKAFVGKSKASLIASILTAEPQPISMMQPMAPATFDRIVRKCLQKEPDDRWHSAHDVAQQLRWITEGPPVDDRRPRASRSVIPWLVAVSLAVVTVLLATIVARDRAAHRAEPVVRTAILPPAENPFDLRDTSAPPAVSSDGRKIVFGAIVKGQGRHLFLRTLDSNDARLLPGTQGALFPFWSPDGRSVGFFTQDSLKRIDITGGAPVVLTQVGDGRGGSWSPDGQTIIFAGRYTPIYCVPSSGGKPVEVTKLQQASTHRWPTFLPDGKHFLFLSSVNGNEDPSNQICIGSLDGNMQRPVIGGTVEPYYVDGAIVFVRNHILTALPFDAKKLAVTGEAVPLQEASVDVSSLLSHSVASVSPAGTLVYQPDRPVRLSQLVWRDRTGRSIGVVGDPRPYNVAILTPDATAVVAAFSPAAKANLWRFDLQRGTSTRLTFGSGYDLGPVWSADGKKLLYTSLGGGIRHMVIRDMATGAEETFYERTVIGTVGNPITQSWSSDGRIIVFTESGLRTRTDIFWMSLDEKKPHPYAASDFVETTPRLSPDGKWLTYQSNESGVFEVYLAPFPPTGGKWQVSTKGGVTPRWRGDGRELFYIDDAKIVSVPVTLGASPQIGAVTQLFELPKGSVPSFDVTRDGQRFLCIEPVGDEPPPAPLIVVQNFNNALREALERR